jgi:hypothetical protein
LVKGGNNQAGLESKVWLTDRIRVDISEALRGNDNPLFNFINEMGFPLKLIASSMSGDQIHTMELTAVEVIKKEMDPAEFTIPGDYLISDMSGLLEGY